MEPKREDTALPSQSANGKITFKYAASHEWIKICQTISTENLPFSNFKDECFTLLINDQFNELFQPTFDNECCDLSCIDDVVNSLKS